MSLTLYICSTLPMLVMLAVAFVDPQTHNSGGKVGGREDSATAAPNDARPEPHVPSVASDSGIDDLVA